MLCYYITLPMNTTVMKNLKLLLTIFLALVLSHPLSAKPKVVASIKPLGLIAEALLGDLATVEVLLPNNADPHHYTLKVSDRRQLQEADLFIWMGPEFERFLIKPLESLDNTGKLALANLEEAKNSEGRQQETGLTSDPHQWLSPKYAALMSQAIANNLVARYPQLQSSLTTRLTTQESALEQLNQHLLIKLFPYQNFGFVADHNAYQLLANTYSLKQIGWVIEHADVAPSAQHLQELSDLIAAQQPECLLIEEGQKSATLSRWAERWQLQAVTIDILGVQTNISSYHALMDSVLESLLTCFDKS